MDGGKLPAARVQEWGKVSLHNARKLLDEWTLRGWVSKDASRDNSFCITSKTRDFLANQQTA